MMKKYNYIIFFNFLFMKYNDVIHVCPKCGEKMIPGEECTHVWRKLGKKTFIGSTPYYTFACEKCGFMESYLRITKNL